ncbi:DNA/RNA non-specific endonuclease [Streptomyces sp. NBC_00347]|uniref:DNA/RNA non-specific endonuclease n=1 Tax=Streptomyces sp. NBC_00347 TaxID=2975721 RepID=UPI0022517B61|nr:DNA/RNA non-specific endonuclease [Streptomyces sp. NBC_00347]MCX5122918.1 DNA/RNA non-specific endonuclease [Streptomyces sp. NBC_00347]
MLAGATPALVHNCPIYSEIENGRRGAAYVEVTPESLASNGGTPPGGKKPDGFRKGDSRGHLIGRQFGGSGTDMRNIIAQGKDANNVTISKIEVMIADHVRDTGRAVIMSVSPVYGAAKYRAEAVRIEAVDDFGWSFDQTVSNF